MPKRLFKDYVVTFKVRLKGKTQCRVDKYLLRFRNGSGHVVRWIRDVWEMVKRSFSHKRLIETGSGIPMGIVRKWLRNG